MIQHEKVQEYLKLKEELVKLTETQNKEEKLFFNIKREVERVVYVISKHIGLKPLSCFIDEVTMDVVYHNSFDFNKEYSKYQKFDVNGYLTKFPIEWLSMKNNEIKKELKKNFIIPKDINNPFGKSKLNKKMENFLNDLSKEEIKHLKEYLNDTA